MRKLGLLLLLVAVMFVYSNEAFAGGIQKGASEFSVNGSLSNLVYKVTVDDSKAKDTTNGVAVRLGYSYFLTDQISAGVDLMLEGDKSKTTYGDTTTKSSSLTKSIDLNAKYHLIFSKGQTVVPYLGLQGGWLGMSTKSGDTSGNDTAVFYGGMGGVKYFISENVSFNTELNYRHYKIALSEYANAKATYDNLSLLLGFSVYFGK